MQIHKHIYTLYIHTLTNTQTYTQTHTKRHARTNTDIVIENLHMSFAYTDAQFALVASTGLINIRAVLYIIQTSDGKEIDTVNC